MSSGHEDLVLRLLDDVSVDPADAGKQQLEATVASLEQALAEESERVEALRASEAEWRQLVESMPQIVWITRPDGWHTHFNRKWLDYTGLTLEESLGDRWNPAFHPDDRGLAMVRWAEATRTGQPYEIEYRLRRFDGVYRWMLGRAVPMRDADGTIVRWFGTCTDIDDLKRAQDRIDAQAHLLDQIRDAVVVHDLDHRIRYWNRAAERIHGFTRDEVLGRTLAESICPDLAQVTAAQQVLLEQGEWSGELRCVNRNGRTVVMEGRWSLLRDTDGHPNAVLAVNTDVTQRRVIEDQYLAVLEARATRDPLTDLPNRSALFERLELLLSQRQRAGIAVAFIDLDEFKPVNDRFGHRVGDQLLVHVAEQLRATIRQGDIAARIGGDEFVVVGEAGDEHMARHLAERLAAVLDAEVELGDVTVTLAASVGVAFVGRDEQPDPDDLLSRADAAMYAVKRRRRDPGDGM